MQSSPLAFSSRIGNDDLDTAMARGRDADSCDGCCLHLVHHQLWNVDLRLVRRQLSWPSPHHPTFAVPGVTTLFRRPEAAVCVLSAASDLGVLHVARDRNRSAHLFSIRNSGS